MLRRMMIESEVGRLALIALVLAVAVLILFPASG